MFSVWRWCSTSSQWGFFSRKVWTKWSKFYGNKIFIFRKPKKTSKQTPRKWLNWSPSLFVHDTKSFLIAKTLRKNPWNLIKVSTFQPSLLRRKISDFCIISLISGLSLCLTKEILVKWISLRARLWTSKEPWSSTKNLIYTFLWVRLWNQISLLITFLCQGVFKVARRDGNCI